MSTNRPSTKRFRSPEAISYFEMCLSEGDPALITAAIGDMARAHGVDKIAEESGLSIDYLRQAFSVNGNPNFSTVVRVLKALGLTLNACSVAPQHDTALFAKINDAINCSGRLSMLSQRLAKCYLQIGQSIDAAKSTQIFDASLMLFDQQLIELKMFAATMGIHALLLDLERGWTA